VVLQVEDDGDGLPEELAEGGGLTGMRERALLIGAELKIESVPDGGVAVTLRIPVAERGTQ
jgi:two-component system sensor histidine kinase UhpB